MTLKTAWGEGNSTEDKRLKIKYYMTVIILVLIPLLVGGILQFAAALTSSPLFLGDLFDSWLLPAVVISITLVIIMYYINNFLLFRYVKEADERMQHLNTRLLTFNMYQYYLFMNAIGPNSSSRLKMHKKITILVYILLELLFIMVAVISSL